MLARVNLDQGQKEAGTNQLEKSDDDIGQVAIHMTACPLEHLIGVHIHGGDAGEEDEDDEEVEDEERGEVLLVGEKELQLFKETSLYVVSFNGLLNMEDLEIEQK